MKWNFTAISNRNLLKPMMIVTSTGYIVEAVGPHLADRKKFRCKNHIIGTDTQSVVLWICYSKYDWNTVTAFYGDGILIPISLINKFLNHF